MRYFGTMQKRYVFTIVQTLIAFILIISTFNILLCFRAKNYPTFFVSIFIVLICMVFILFEGYLWKVFSRDYITI